MCVWGEEGNDCGFGQGVVFWSRLEQHVRDGVEEIAHIDIHAEERANNVVMANENDLGFAHYVEDGEIGLYPHISSEGIENVEAKGISDMRD